ncbi:FHA domain-containing protein [Myxococcota bacterium]|nr:FHA domain-containing protein [Myxococcota bacterium]
MATLRVWESKTAFNDWPISEHGARVGWDVHGDDAIQLPRVEYISKLHAQILPQSGGAWIIHDRSANGTFVDGVRIQGLPIVLRDGVPLDFAGVVSATFYVNGPQREIHYKPVEEPQPKPPPPLPPTPVAPAPAPPPPSWLLRDLRSGSSLIRTHAGGGSVRVQKMRLSLEALARAVQDPDPEVARAALARELDRRGVLSKELQNLDEVFSDILKVLDSFDKKINQAEDAGR